MKYFYFLRHITPVKEQDPDNTCTDQYMAMHPFQNYSQFTRLRSIAQWNTSLPYGLVPQYHICISLDYVDCKALNIVDISHNEAEVQGLLLLHSRYVATFYHLSFILTFVDGLCVSTCCLTALLCLYPLSPNASMSEEFFFF